MRARALVVFVGAVALVASGCGDTPMATGSFGNNDPNSQNFSAVDPTTGLTQFITIQLDPAGATNGQAGATRISTWVQNQTFAPVTADIRNCGIEPQDVQAGLNLMAVDAPSCGSDDSATVTLQPGQQTAALTTDFRPAEAGTGTYPLSIRLLVVPEFWMMASITY